MVWSLFNADDRDCENDKYDGDDGNDEKHKNITYLQTL